MFSPPSSFTSASVTLRDVQIMDVEELCNKLYRQPADVVWEWGRKVVHLNGITVDLDEVTRYFLDFNANHFSLSEREAAISIAEKIKSLNYAAHVKLRQVSCIQRVMYRLQKAWYGDAADYLSENAEQLQERFRTFTEGQYKRDFPNEPLPEYPRAYTSDGTALYTLPVLPENSRSR